MPSRASKSISFCYLSKSQQQHLPFRRIEREESEPHSKKNEATRRRGGEVIVEGIIRIEELRSLLLPILSTNKLFSPLPILSTNKLFSPLGGGPYHQQKAHSVKYQNLSHYGGKNTVDLQEVIWRL